MLQLVVAMMVVVVAVSHQKGYKNGMCHTLDSSWVQKTFLLAFHYNMMKNNPEHPSDKCCNPARSSQGCTAEVNIWFSSVGQAHFAEQTC